MRKWLAVIAMLGVLAVCAALVAGPARAAGLSPPVADCYANSRLTRSYTIQQLQNALNTIPIDIKEYSNCENVIQHQLLLQLSELKGTDSSGSGGGSFLPTWLIVVLALVVIGGVGFGVAAMRRRPSPGG